jgi:hypothetical protein
MSLSLAGGSGTLQYLLKMLLAGCSKRSQMRGARKIDPSTVAQDRLPASPLERFEPLEWFELFLSSEAIERNEAYEAFSAAC